MAIETSRSTQGVEKLPDTVLTQDHWFKVIERLYDQESGEIPDSLQIRAAAIISALDLPTGQYSDIGIDQAGNKIGSEKGKIIAQYLTNNAGVLMQEQHPLIVSEDFRDIYLDGLPSELKKIIDPDALSIMEIGYKHGRHIKNVFGNTENNEKTDFPMHYLRLAGGIDLFLKGYAHSKFAHENSKNYLQKINKHAKIISIEGFGDEAFGESLGLRWSEKSSQIGSYDALMHEAVDSGFSGYFTEVDARDASKIGMDNPHDLPDSFFEKYFSFLQREHPVLAQKIGGPKDMKKILVKQSSTPEQLRKRDVSMYLEGKRYSSHPYLETDGTASLEPTFLELGQRLFSDALAAIKLHLIARLMADGHLPKGPIIDYCGANHLPSKSFFLRYPGYAMEVVLRTVNELMAGRAEEKGFLLKWFNKGDINKIYQTFENPDWKEIIKEITRLEFKKVEDDVSKPTAPGSNQRKLLEHPVDFLQLYKIDPAKIMPTSADIEKIRQKLLRAQQRKALPKSGL